MLSDTDLTAWSDSTGVGLRFQPAFGSIFERTGGTESQLSAPGRSSDGGMNL